MCVNTVVVSQPERTPNEASVVFGERWWIPSAAVLVVMTCGVVISLYMRLNRFLKFINYLPKKMDLSRANNILQFPICGPQ